MQCCATLMTLWTQACLMDAENKFKVAKVHLSSSICITSWYRQAGCTVLPKVFEPLPCLPRFLDLAQYHIACSSQVTSAYKFLLVHQFLKQVIKQE